MSNSNLYDIGDAVVLSARFVDPTTEEDTDPEGQISITIKSPSGVETKWVYVTNPQVVKNSVGNYSATTIVNTAGRWYYRWSALNQAQEEGSFSVRQGKVTPAT